MKLKRSPERSEWVLISESFLIVEPVTAFRALNGPLTGFHAPLCGPRMLTRLAACRALIYAP
jgi:hypothetical protein